MFRPQAGHRHAGSVIGSVSEYKYSFRQLFPDTDSLYIDLSEQPSAESREISEGVVLDYDASGNLVGIDIDNASTKVDLHRFVVSKLPASVETIAG